MQCTETGNLGQTQFIANRIPQPQRFPGIGQKQATGPGQGHTAVVALKQGHAEFLFKPPDAAAQSRGAHMAGFTGSSEMQIFSKKDKLFQGAGIHASHCCTQRIIKMHIYHFTQYS